MAEKTKDRVLDVALRLFNEQGTGAVSTNHIADAAAISPGNLYYHYRNKEEIIRALFERLFAATDVAFNLPSDRLPMLEDVQGWIQANFRLLWDYRFIYREMLPLLRQDAELHARYLVIRQRGYEGFQEIINALVAGGIVTLPPDPDTITRLADLCWLITEFWLAEVEISGQAVEAAQMQRGVELMTEVLRPYLNP